MTEEREERFCSISGCGRPVLARGWCNRHWLRWSRHGDPLGGRQRVELRWEDQNGSLLVTTAGGQFRVDAGTEAILREHRWYVDRGARSIPYVRAGVGRGSHVYLHRLLLDAPAGMQVDHVSGDSLDNRVANLRLCGQRGNQANQRVAGHGASRYKGVVASGRRRPWVAQIGVDYRGIYLGSFMSEKDAALAYDAAARRYFGEFARLNFPEVTP